MQRLVEIGAIVPAGDGKFGRGDVIRSRVVAAFESAGFRSAAEECPDLEDRLLSLGDVTLKGLDTPIALFRWPG